jgi:S1-C subfamily serine protease
MSDRPEDYTDPENTEPEPTGQEGAEHPDAPWWHQPHGGAPAWGSQGGWPQGGWLRGGAGQSEAPEGTYPRSPYPQSPPGPPGYGPGGPPGYGPGGPSGYGPPGYGPYGPGGTGGSGGWQGGQWPGGQWGWGPPAGGWGLQVRPSTPGSRPRRKGLAAVVATVFTVIALLIGVGIGYDVWSAGSSSPTSGRSVLPGGTTSRSTFTTTSSSTAGTKVSSATGAPSDIATIRAKVKPALVDINTVLGYETETAAGTGMVLTPTGKVLTNNHVIEGATKISATDLGNGKTYSASVLGYTRTNDIAVIQLRGASGLETVHVGNSSTVKVGEAVVGIGNAGGTGGVPSAAGGSVTALDQSITASDQGSLGMTYEHLTGLIESNADIQPGDSGGPLVTTSGSVVGMDTAASESEGYSFQGAVTGQGYSIPINEAIATARKIISRKATSSVHIGGTAFLGVYVGSARARTGFNRFGFGSTSTSTPRTSTSTSRTSSPTKGAFVEQVIPNTPAQTAGLAATDVITSIGGSSVASPSDLTKILLRYHPGDAVKVRWTTGSGQAETSTITFASGPPE